MAAAPTIDGCPVLPANNIWNARVDTLPLHPKSRWYVNTIGPTRRFHMDFGSGLYPYPPDPDAAPIGIPYITVPGTQPKVPVVFGYADESDPGPYPIPPNAPIEGVGASNPQVVGDRHVLVVDRDNCVLYETFYSFPVNGGASWTADAGAIWPLTSNALRPATWTSADAAGLPILPGLARYEEAIAPSGIQHALRFTVPQTQNTYIWPATHQASSSTDVNRPPMGLRMRLKASYNINGFSPQAKAIAQAMKTYGILNADNGSAWFVSGSPNAGWDNDVLHQLDVLRGSDFEAVDASSLMVSATSGQVQPRPSKTTIASSLNPSAAGQSVTFTATVTGNDGPITGTVGFIEGVSTIAGCGAVPIVGGTAACPTSAIPAGVRIVAATYSGNTVYAVTGAIMNQVVTSGPALLSTNPTTLAFAGQSMNTTSPAQPVTITNSSGGSVTVSTVVAPGGYAVNHNCTTLAPAATCTANVTFTPAVQGNVNGLLAVTYSGGGPTTASLTGIGERSLVTHYYRSILRRAPDAPGKAFWDNESARLVNIGANINEAWFAMAQFFYFSAEYAAFNRTNSEFVTDLYNTFFNRAPDGPGLAYWADQLNQGMPREVVLAAFMFSTEFATFAQNIFGNTAAAAEVDAVLDFYRGLLARLPDQGGYDFWVAQFRTAQCAGTGAAGAVYTQVESISSQFATGGEYTSKNRNNSQYVGDLYNAFLRRGGDLNGVNFWINQLNTAAMTREQVRQQFIASGEFTARVNNVIAQGCLP